MTNRGRLLRPEQCFTRRENPLLSRLETGSQWRFFSLPVQRWSQLVIRIRGISSNGLQRSLCTLSILVVASDRQGYRSQTIIARRMEVSFFLCIFSSYIRSSATGRIKRLSFITTKKDQGHHGKITYEFQYAYAKSKQKYREWYCVWSHIVNSLLIILQ